MTSSPDDETKPERNRHRSSESRMSRWRRRHGNEEVAELTAEDVAKLMRRTARADREGTADEVEGTAEPAETVHRESADDTADSRVFSDTLERGLADPTPPDRRHLLPRRRHDAERAEVPEGEEPEVARPEETGRPDLEARLRAAEERAEENAARLRHVREDLAAAQDRARQLAEELAARDEELQERSTTLAADRADVEERVHALAQSLESAAEERARLEQVVADQARLLEETQQEHARAREQIEHSAEQLRQMQADLEQAEQRARTLATESAARASEHSERVRALVAEREAAEEHTGPLSESHQALTEARARAAEEARARAVAEARAAALEQQLDEAHVLPVFSPAEPFETASPGVARDPEPQEEPAPVDEPDPWLAPAEAPEAWFEVEPVAEPEAEAEPEDAEPEVEEPEPELEDPELEEQEPEPARAPAPAPKVPVAARAASPTYDAKRGTGLIGVLAGLVAMACAAAVGWLAYQEAMLDRAHESIALTVAAVLAMAVALRRRSKSSEVHLDRGTLRLRFGDTHHTFYLNSPSTQLKMNGLPGDRDWRLQVLRRGMAPVTIDGKDVDPVAFTEALQQWRPTV